MINRKKILKEFSVEEVLKENEYLTIIGRVCVGNIRVGDCFNSLYKIQTPNKSDVSSELEYELSNIRAIKIIVKSIEFRQKLVKEVFCGDVAKLTLEGEGMDKISKQIDLSDVDLLGNIKDVI